MTDCIAAFPVLSGIGDPTLLGAILKTVHITADLVLVSTLLAGVRRNSGLTKLENESAIYYGKKYLNIGERAFDYTSAWLGSNDFFTRN
ncbi:DUF1748-domain-containing protein [Metschnikowia bicuspidata]|uniref:DUF1748-domain-containing protein n=1 Tax=Metschnikowia bicuspidata TaxID=27322 RepID=A0A4V1J2F3_9ASCO|nr:DUF1748-domain-containing protein [Metschnikowia bicuspidata]RKP31154.1 DUF1748-domain-containing protein [Metschnikowia bicuspidata]